jgi:hypothetical protein
LIRGSTTHWYIEGNYSSYPVDARQERLRILLERVVILWWWLQESISMTHGYLPNFLNHESILGNPATMLFYLQVIPMTIFELLIAWWWVVPMEGNMGQ